MKEGGEKDERAQQDKNYGEHYNWKVGIIIPGGNAKEPNIYLAFHRTTKHNYADADHG
jgi:hypothetical protein